MRAIVYNSKIVLLLTFGAQKKCNAAFFGQFDTINISIVISNLSDFSGFVFSEYLLTQTLFNSSQVTLDCSLFNETRCLAELPEVQELPSNASMQLIVNFQTGDVVTYRFIDNIL